MITLFPLDPRVRCAQEGVDGGVFSVSALIPGRGLRVIASNGLGWEHVSVSVEGRKATTPTWAEMDHVRHLWWGPDDVVVQFHPKKSEHISDHDGCLHLWRPTEGEFPTPERGMVGLGVGPEEVARRRRLLETRVEDQLRALAPLVKKHVPRARIEEILGLAAPGQPL